MENMDKPRKARRGRPAAPKQHADGGTKNLNDVQIKVHFILDGDDIRCTMDVPHPETTSEAVDNAEKLGTLLALIQTGKILPVVNFAIARCGIINDRVAEFEYAMKAMHVGMSLGLPGADNKEVPVVSPTDAFLFRKES
jgi:hypothetical protein